MSDPKTIGIRRNDREHRNMSHRVKMIAIGLLLIVLAPPHAATRGQAMVSSGHALDSNLRIGSGGYNGGGGGGGGRFRGGGSGFRRGAYNAHHGGIDRYNAFVGERAYSPLRWTGGGRPGGIDNRAGAAARMPAGSRQVASSPRVAGFSETYDRGYEAGLAESEYESETAQQQANVLSYGIGFAIGEEVRAILEADQVGADLPSVIAGFREALHDSPPRMSDDEMEELLHAVFERITGERTGERLLADPEFKAELEQNEASGKTLHERLASDPEVVTLDNGLQYKVIVAGTGDTPSATDVVSVKYRLLNPEGEYVSDPIRTQIILRSALEGVHIALTSMKVGGVWRVAMPSKLAHGVNGRPPLHGPGVTLYFEVELLAIH